MATKGKGMIAGQITFAFFEQEKSKVKNFTKKENKKEEVKLKPIKLKHRKRSNYGDFKRKSL